MTQPLPDIEEAAPDQLLTQRKCPFNPDELSELRERQPLSRIQLLDGHESWLVTNHEMARAVLSDPRFAIAPGGFAHVHPDKQATQVYDAVRDQSGFPGDVLQLIDRYAERGQIAHAFRDPVVVRALHENPLSKLPFFFWDPPEHGRLRRLMTAFFTPRRVNAQRAQVEAIVKRCLDDMERIGSPVDLVQNFALAIPSLMSCALFGIPENDRSVVEHLAAVRARPGATSEEYLAANEDMRAFVRDLIQSKRAQPTDDILSALVSGGQMSEEELVSTAVILIRGAHPTTAATISVGVATLLRDRQQWEKLISGPDQTASIVEEILRFTSVVQSTDLRTALEDIDLGGTTIKAFETVAISLTAANRDPEVFPDPDQFDPSRQAVQHLTFSYGVHQCIGQHLARLELQVAFSELARRFPTLELAVPAADLDWQPGNVFGPVQLPVTW